VIVVRESDTATIRQLVEDWVIFRDSGDWERFRSVWHNGGWMTATWLQGDVDKFIEASRQGMASGVNIMHFLGGFACEVTANRAIAQTKMQIMQRAVVHGVEVDVTCTGRFYDFFERRQEKWGIVRRQPIYEKDRMDAVDPAASLSLDAETLASYPAGYRHLAYLQESAGYAVRRGLPGMNGAEVELLYREGEEWLAGSATPGVPLGAEQSHD
jgi:hypothetical protein